MGFDGAVDARANRVRADRATRAAVGFVALAVDGLEYGGGFDASGILENVGFRGMEKHEG